MTWPSHGITFSIILPHKYSKTVTDTDLCCVSVEVTTNICSAMLGDGKWGSCQERVRASVQKKAPVPANRSNWSACKFKVPHLGASPDGLLTCTCCGDGLLEIKCPYSLRHTTLNSAGKDFYLQHTPDGLKLSTSHAYYYQVQGQLEICDRLYCDCLLDSKKCSYWADLQKHQFLGEDEAQARSLFCLRYPTSCFAWTNGQGKCFTYHWQISVLLLPQRWKGRRDSMRQPHMWLWVVPLFMCWLVVRAPRCLVLPWLSDPTTSVVIVCAMYTCCI